MRRRLLCLGARRERTDEKNKRDNRACFMALVAGTRSPHRSCIACRIFVAKSTYI
jgi:hypothetical protein